MSNNAVSERINFCDRDKTQLTLLFIRVCSLKERFSIVFTRKDQREGAACHKSKKTSHILPCLSLLKNRSISVDRVVSKRLSKAITRLQLLRLLTGLKLTRQLIHQPIRWKTKTNRDLHARFFPRFEQVAWNCYEFGLDHYAVCAACCECPT